MIYYLLGYMPGVKKYFFPALAGVAQWIERGPANQKVLV